jgi:hypothetical protein
MSKNVRIGEIFLALLPALKRIQVELELSVDVNHQ